MAIDYRSGALAIVLMAAILTAEVLALGSQLGVTWALVGQLTGYASLALALAYVLDHVKTRFATPA